MKKILIGIILIIILFSFTGCVSEVQAEQEYRFKIIQRWSNNAVIVDKETKVQYFIYDRTGITVLVDAEGKPLLYEGE